MADRPLRMDEQSRSGCQEHAAVRRSLRPDIARNHDVATQGEKFASVNRRPNLADGHTCLSQSDGGHRTAQCNGCDNRHRVAAPTRMTHVPKVAASNTMTQPVIHRKYLNVDNFVKPLGVTAPGLGR